MNAPKLALSNSYSCCMRFYQSSIKLHSLNTSISRIASIPVRRCLSQIRSLTRPVTGSEMSSGKTKEDGYREAAIACILRRGPDNAISSNNNRSNSNDGNPLSNLHLLLIKRAIKERDPWSGDVALPGGKVENGETSISAAVRETREEVGIDIEGLEYLGVPLKPVVMNRGKHKNMVVRTHIFKFQISNSSDNISDSNCSSSSSLSGSSSSSSRSSSSSDALYNGIYGDQFKLEPNFGEIHSCWWQPLHELNVGYDEDPPTTTPSVAFASTKKIELSYERLKHYLRSSLGGGMTWMILRAFGISSIHFKSIVLRPSERLELTFADPLDRDKYLSNNNNNNNNGPAIHGINDSGEFILWGMTLGVVLDLLEFINTSSRDVTATNKNGDLNHHRDVWGASTGRSAIKRPAVWSRSNHIRYTASHIGFAVDSYYINRYLLFMDTMMTLLGINSAASYSRGSAFRRLMLFAGSVFVSSSAVGVYVMAKMYNMYI